MPNLRAWVETIFYLTPDIELKLLSSSIIVLLMALLRLLAIKLINAQIEDEHHRYHWRKVIAYFITILGLLLIGRTWITGIESVVTFLGLTSAGIAIALRTPLTSLVAWTYIVWQRPFVVGDRIQIGEDAGDIIDLGPLKFTMLEIGNWVEADQSTGRIMYVPNGEIFSRTLANYTTGLDYIWHELEVRLTFESDWETGKTCLTEIAQRNIPDVSEAAQRSIHRASRRFLIHYDNLTPIVYTSVCDYGITLTLRYLCQPRRRRGIHEAIWEDILRTFRQHPHLEFAYPTQRFYNRPFESSVVETPEKTDNV